MDKVKCIECGKEVKLIHSAKPCPACKDGRRCFNCWSKHVENKVCAYGKAEVLAISF